MSIIYFHIGYPKAASTFLQKNIFKNQKKINFINDNFNDEFIEFTKFLFWSDDEEFNLKIKSYVKFLNNINDDKINVISHEGYTNFSSNPQFKIQLIFKRLKKISEICKIKYKFIFVIRKQTEYIKSRYAQGHGLTGFYSVNKKYLKFNELKKYFYKSDRSNNELEAFETFNYYKTYIDLKKIFNDDPKILVFEDLKSSPQKFVDELLGFMNLRDSFSLNNLDFSIKNPGRKTTTGEYFRKRNIYHKPYLGVLNVIAKYIPLKKYIFKLFSRNLKEKIKILSYKFDRIIKGHDRIVFNKNDEIEIKKYYSEGNQNLSKILKKDLEKLGY